MGFSRSTLSVPCSVVTLAGDFFTSGQCDYKAVGWNQISRSIHFHAKHLTQSSEAFISHGVTFLNDSLMNLTPISESQ